MFDKFELKYKYTNLIKMIKNVKKNHSIAIYYIEIKLILYRN